VLTSVCFLLYIMNSNFLLKDELLYEIGIRAIISYEDVQTLRKLLRSVVPEDLPVNLNKVSSVGVK
jgi:hypothetical protein